MIRLARAQPEIAVLSFDLRCATPVLPVATGRNVSSPPRSLPKQAFNATRQQTASTEIPIASDARSLHTSRGFLPWRFAYAGPGARRATFMGPASANLHRSGHPARFPIARKCGHMPSGDTWRFWGEGVRLHGENARDGTRWKDRVRDRCSVRHWTGDRDRLRPGGGESHALRH